MKTFVEPVNNSKTINDPIHEIKMLLKMMNKRHQEQLAFFNEMASAFRDHLHTDILVKPGKENGPAIHAHKAVLAAKSVVFKNMIDSKLCKDTCITLPELNHEELEIFLGFLYSGHLGVEEIHKNYPSLLDAAKNYKITYLEKFCVREMNKSLNENNVFELLEIADACSDKSAKGKALDFIKENKSILLSTRYDALARKKPHLAVDITRYVSNILSEGEKGMSYRDSWMT